MDRKYIFDKKNNTFIKEYPQYDNINKKVALEYEKGIILNKIINYPKPLTFHDNEIQYELLDIKYSLAEAKSNNKLKCSDLYFIGGQLRKIHNEGIIHGDFSLVNVVFVEDVIYFIDASFSFYNTEGEVIIESDEIFKDISLFLMHLKTSNSLIKWWTFFQISKIRESVNSFLDGYFDDRKKELDCKKELIYENKAILNNIRCYKANKGDLVYRYVMIMVLYILFFHNKISILKFSQNE